MAKAPGRTRDPLTLKHYRLFGGIVVEYARVEVGLRLMLAAYIGQGISRALILSAPYTSAHIRNVAKAMTKHLLPDGNPVRDAVIHAIGAHKSAGVLRNDISHNLWRRGARSRSIAPMFVEIRNEKAEFKGIAEGDRDYTLEELQHTLDALIDANERLIEIQTHPEFEPLFERNISPSSQDSEDSDGNS